MHGGAGSHALMGGKLGVYNRPGGRFWQCSAYEARRNRRVSTTEESLAQARQVGGLVFRAARLAAQRRDQGRKAFKEAAALVEREYEIITEGQRNPQYVEDHKRCLKIHLIRFFGHMACRKSPSVRCSNTASTAGKKR